MRTGSIGLFAMVAVLCLVMTCSQNDDEDNPGVGLILFSASTTGAKNPQLYRMNDDGSDQVRITPGYGFFNYAQWSRDKSLIAAYSEGGASGNVVYDIIRIYLMDSQGIILDSLPGGLSNDGRFTWLESNTRICYPHSAQGSFYGYYVCSCSPICDRDNELQLKIQHDSATGDLRIFDSLPNDENRLLAKYQMKEKITVNGRSIINYYWCFGEISTQGEILKVYFRLDNTYVVKAKYSPDGLKMAYLPNGNTITIMVLANPERPVDINFEKSAGYTVTSIAWAPNSIDLALSLDQGSLSGIYRYEVRDMNLKPILVSDSATYLLGDYR